MQDLLLRKKSGGDAVYTDGPDAGLDPATRYRNRRRLRVFVLAVTVSLALGLAYTFLRPAVYESSATLLVTPPVVDERATEVSNTQYVELELRSLGGYRLLSELRERLSSATLPGGTGLPTLPELQGMLAAEVIGNTNLIRLSASGPDRYLLPVVLDAWIKTYLAVHDQSIEADSTADSEAVEQQLAELKTRIEEKRLALEQYRSDHDIVSMERDENRILKRLAGLTDALNKASEERVTAQARLDAIRAAIAQGKPVGRSDGQEGINNLEQRLVAIQEQLKALEDEFTPRYMSVDPEIKGLVRKRDLLQEEIRNKRHEGTQAALAQAEQDAASARHAVASLQRQLDEHKQQVMEFTTRFAEHEALQEELLQLETAFRKAQDRQLQIEVNARRQYPQVKVKELAYLPERPVAPDYARDAGISAAASLLIGLLMLWLYDHLTRSGGHSVMHEIRQVFVSPETPQLGQLPRAPLPQPIALAAPDEQSRRELSQAEVVELLRATGPDIRLLIVCLLSGLTAGEARVLHWADIDAEAGCIRVGGENSRNLPLTAPLLAAVAALRSVAGDADAPLWHDAGGRQLEADDIAAMLLSAAHDAGLARPQDVTPEAVRHTYLAYLVRKGVRLNDLARIAGWMAPSALAAYAVYSPPGVALPLDAVESVYPALSSFYQCSPDDGQLPLQEDPA